MLLILFFSTYFTQKFSETNLEVPWWFHTQKDSQTPAHPDSSPDWAPQPALSQPYRRKKSSSVSIWFVYTTTTSGTCRENAGCFARGDSSFQTHEWERTTDRREIVQVQLPPKLHSHPHLLDLRQKQLPVNSTRSEWTQRNALSASRRSCAIEWQFEKVCLCVCCSIGSIIYSVNHEAIKWLTRASCWQTLVIITATTKATRSLSQFNILAGVKSIPASSRITAAPGCSSPHNEQENCL